MNPDKVILEDFNKMFEYEKISRDIDSIDDLETLKNISKSYVKLYLNNKK